MQTSRWTAIALLFALAPLIAKAAGADGSWTWCSAPARLQPTSWGRPWHVATWGSDPGSCPSSSGYTFRTISAAVRCAWGGDTIYVHNGTYGPVSISNVWPSNDILITNADGENPVIEGWSSVGDYQSIFSIWNASHIAVQGLDLDDVDALAVAVVHVVAHELQAPLPDRPAAGEARVPPARRLPLVAHRGIGDLV
ncbi:MAG: hypothetical protein ACXWLL_02335, partial [Myxococcaceae bacterium]